jgi:hypothetical protein
VHGVIFVQFRAFCEARGIDWEAVHERAKLVPTPYLPIQSYKTEFIKLLVRAAADLAPPSENGWSEHGSENALLEDFGKFVAPSLLKYPGVEIPYAWRTADVLEHVENLIHRTVRRVDPNSRPPPLKAHRTAPNRVILTYSSPVRWCAFGKGIVRGIALSYSEQVEIQERSCMLLGAEVCELAVRVKGTTLNMQKVEP